MSFDNEYPNRKDKRKKYRGSKRFDRSCRNHGGCPYCESNRQFANKRRTLDDDRNPYELGEDDGYNYNP